MASKEAFRAGLNRHGYPFQSRCVEAARRSDMWSFEVMEFPVAVGDDGTRIDFVLKAPRTPMYLLVECKRANPALQDWCFAQFPSIRRGREDERLVVEYVDFTVTGCLAHGQWGQSLSGVCYHIGFEVKSESSGDPRASGRGGIEKAASQVCRGLNGIVEFFRANRRVMGTEREAYLIPVIFTTAKLWSCDVNLASATCLASGEIARSDMTDPEPREWLCYQYHLSPGIKHSASGDPPRKGLPAALDSLYVRTIPVVTANGIEAFLRGFDQDCGQFGPIEY